MADREGFEPSLHFCKHAFQACAIDHSAICPFDDVFSYRSSGRGVREISCLLARNFRDFFCAVTCGSLLGDFCGFGFRRHDESFLGFLVEAELAAGGIDVVAFFEAQGRCDTSIG